MVSYIVIPIILCTVKIKTKQSHTFLSFPLYQSTDICNLQFRNQPSKASILDFDSEDKSVKQDVISLLTQVKAQQYISGHYSVCSNFFDTQTAQNRVGGKGVFPLVLCLILEVVPNTQVRACSSLPNRRFCKLSNVAQ